MNELNELVSKLKLENMMKAWVEEGKVRVAVNLGGKLRIFALQECQGIMSGLTIDDLPL